MKKRRGDLRVESLGGREQHDDGFHRLFVNFVVGDIDIFESLRNEKRNARTQKTEYHEGKLQSEGSGVNSSSSQ